MKLLKWLKWLFTPTSLEELGIVVGSTWVEGDWEDTEVEIIQVNNKTWKVRYIFLRINGNEQPRKFASKCTMHADTLLRNYTKK